MKDDPQKIDVLEIMASDASEAGYERERVQGHKRTLEARSESTAAQYAVAELIQAAQKVADRCWMHMENDSLYEMQELRAALSRVKG